MTTGPRDKPYPIVLHIDSITGKPIRLAESSSVYLDSLSSVTVSATSISATNWYGLPAGQVAYVSSLGDVSPDLVSQLETGKSLVWSGTEWIASSIGGDSANLTELSSTVTGHIADSDIHFTSGSLSSYYAASSWVDANYSPTGHVHDQYALTSTLDELSSTVTGHIADSTIHFTADSLTGTYATTASLNDYVLTSINNALSTAVTDHITSASVHFTSGSLSGYYAASSWVDANYATTGHIHSQYALTSTVNDLNSTVTGHIADSTIHFTADSLTGTYATTAALGSYVLTSTNSNLSSLVYSIEASTVDLSAYIAANEIGWVGGGVTSHGDLANLNANDHPQYVLSTTNLNLSNTVTGHIADSTIHFTADSLTGTYATTASLGNYVLTSTNSNLSSLVSNLEASTNLVTGVLVGHIGDGSLHFTADSLTGTYATTASLGNYVLTSTNTNLSSLVYSIEASTVDLSAYIAANENGWVGGDLNNYVLTSTNSNLSSTVANHIASASVHFTSGSLSGYYAASSWVDANYAPVNHTHSQYALTSTLNQLSSTVTGHIADSTIHFTADSLTGTYATTASLGNYVLTSTNSNLSSLVYNIEASTVDLSAYIAANETSWLTGLTLPNQPCGVLFVAADGISLSANPGIIIDNTISALEVYSNAADNTGGIDLYPNGNLEGFVRWDPDYHTLGIQGENDTRINLGVDEIIPVYNDTGSTVSQGQIVWVSGSQGGVYRGTIALLSTSIEDPFIIGACLKDIAHGSNGYIIKKGLIKNAKKTDVFVTGLTLAAGEVLYVSDQPGKLTNIAPGPGIHTIQFGLFLQESGGGNCSYGVLINKGYDLLDLHDVEASPNQSGQTIVWDTTAGYFVTGDHGSLAGLGDNDHPQYVLSATNLSLSNTVTGHIADSTIHFTAGSLTSTYATTASLGNYVLTSTNNNLSTTVADHIASASVHFTSGSLSGYYAASSWVDANYAPISHSHNQYALTSTLNELSSTVTGHIADSTIHFTADSLTGTYATTAALGNYVLTSTNSILSSTVADHITSASVHFTSGSLSGYYAASSWVDANYTPLTLTSTFETTANAAATYATIASLNNYVLTSTNNNLSTTVNNHISDSTIHFTADSLTGTYATTAALGSYVLTSTNSNLSSLVASIETSTVDLSAYIFDNEGSWGGGGGVPGGSDTQIQYNNAGSFSGSPALTWDNSTSTLVSNSLSALTYLNLPSGTATWNASALAGKPIDTGSWPEAGTGPGVAFYSHTEDKFLTIRLNSSVLNGTRDATTLFPNQGYVVASYLASANDTYFGINSFWNTTAILPGGVPDLPANKDVLVYNDNIYGYGFAGAKGWTWEQLSLSGGYLLDVSSVAPTADKQVLSFDSTTSKWKPGPAITYGTTDPSGGSDGDYYIQYFVSGSTPVEIGIACSDETTDLVSGTAKATFRLPYAMYLTEVRANVNTAPSGSTIIVDINKNGSTLLSTKLSIDANEKTSKTAATPAVISSNTLADDDEITIDIDQIGSTTAGKGLKVWLIGNRL